MGQAPCTAPWVAWVYALVSVAAVSLLSLAGALTLLGSEAAFRRISYLLIAFAVGGLAGDAFIHLLPESFARLDRLTASGLALLGLLSFFLLEKLVRRSERGGLGPAVHPMVTINLVGDGFHNFVDGLLIGASYLVDFQLGLSTTLAVAMHELPHELGDFAVLVHGGLTVRKALVLNLLSGATAVAGTLLSLAVGSSLEGLAVLLVPFTAGGFLYLAGSDLIPELQRRPSTLRGVSLETGLFLLGSGVMALLLLLG
ncbi:MAG: ZIP family metal transporter [Myxococcaceae bacterium]